MDTAEYARLAERFIARLYREEYLQLAGLKDTLETEEIFEAFPGLFTRDVVLGLVEHRENRETRYLAEFAVRGHIEQRLRALTERIANEESAAEVEWPGERLPLRAAMEQLVLEPNRERRRALEEGVAQAVARQNPDRARRVAGQHEIARELGFADYRVLCEELSGQPLQALGAEMAAFVEETESAYRARTAEALERMGIRPGEATDADLRWVVLGPRHEELFSRARLLPAAEATLLKLGVALAEQENVHLDLEPRPKKCPRPFCSPIAVPGEIWVVASPRGGWVDFLSFFHELGHAEHFAHMSPELPCPYRMMGDDGVAEAFAFALQSVVLEKEWLRDVLGVEEVPEGLLEAGQLLDLWYVRRYAGKLAYELVLHGAAGGGAPAAPRYAQLLGQAMGVRVAPEHYLFDVDDGFYCARHLRAWIFEAGLRERLREQFGRAWFQCPEAGAWLKFLWRRGKEWTVEELAREVDLAPGTEPLRRRLLGKV
jgi:hypothetical protein